MKFGIFNFFLLRAVNKHPKCIKMKFEGDRTSIMVSRDFFCDSNYHSFCSCSARKLLWCGWQSWCGWQRLEAGADETYYDGHHDPLPQAIFKKLKPTCAWPAKISFNDVFLCAIQNAESFNGLVQSYCLSESFCQADTVACLQPCCTAIQRWCQGHSGCTGGDGLVSWRVQHECTGTRGQDVDSQVREEETLEQEKKQV